MIGMLFRSMSLVLVLCSVRGFASVAQDPEKLSEDQKREFLLKADVVKFSPVGKGVTGIFRLTLSDGAITHDASFQSHDEAKAKMPLAGGVTEIGFKDSYKFNIAAYELARILGLGEMMPVTVERRWEGKPGALSWWLPFKFDEEQREKQKLKPPSYLPYIRQLSKMNVFAALVYDTDRNKGNILFSEDWHVWMIDFTRAFRLHPDPPNPKILELCERRLWEKLRALNAADVSQAAKAWLTKDEIQALMARRDKIVALFERLIAQKGEKAVIID